MAEGQGFEPWDPHESLVFKTSAFGHSATPPNKEAYISVFQLSVNPYIIYFKNKQY